MIDREKVVRAVETCFDSWIDGHRNMGLDLQAVKQMKHDALDLLKEQELVELLDDGEDFVSIGDRMEITHRWKCGGCGNFVVYCETRPRIKFCHICGREFKRND